ncbi:DinB family protein [Thalassoroseus pseudoceratinae]|uniref:DinB family protein n=1 Tax=Thalassoroseus pseudoceratinae TaxID=2713176 RepID=UPI0014207A60|nr:DinB family protein [Thalassoroseus pseudoceratinae]
MNAAKALKAGFHTPDIAWKMYLEDLTEEEMMLRPCEGANHIKWQIGHLICSDHRMGSVAFPGQIPDLPDGFADRYTKETASVDDGTAFDSKIELLRVAEEQRSALFAALEQATDAELDRATPEDWQFFGPTVGYVIAMIPAHWMMHSGQWAILRRQQGRKPLF